jgi:hypothetical protein
VNPIKFASLARAAFGLALTLGLLACGGGGSGDSDSGPPPSQGNELTDPRIIIGSALPADVHWQPRAGATPGVGNFVYLESEPGDAMARGQSRLFTEVESSIAHVNVNGNNGFRIASVEGQWSGDFTIGNEVYLLPGFYGEAGKFGEQGNGKPGMLWTTEWRECSSLKGWYVVDELVFGSEGLELLVMRFMQYCNGSSTPLKGKVRWSRADHRTAPIAPVPQTLWQPPPASVPSVGSYLYVESDAGDYVGQGHRSLYTTDNATLSVSRVDDFDVVYEQVYVTSGTDVLAGNLFGMGQTKLQRGYYPGVQRYPFGESQLGRMQWYRNGKRCSMVNGWYAVDDVVYYDDQIIALELRFEQRCDDSTSALRGKLRWSIFDVLPSPGPTQPPLGLWQPSAGATPAAGDYVYIESGAGDSIGQGATRLYTRANATLLGTPYNQSFQMRVQSDALWVGDFVTMDSVKTLGQGYYAAVQAMPQRDKGRAAQSWSRNSSACGASDGWVVVDSIRLAANGSIADIEMRFEQHCRGDAGVLRGKLRWSAGETGSVHGLPVPTHLWQPPVPVLPTIGNYVYIESDQADPIGAGRAVVLPQPDYLIAVTNAVATGSSDRATFYFQVDEGTTADWRLAIRSPILTTRLQPGLFGNLRSDFPIGAAGGLEMGGNSKVCLDHSTGWYAIDSVTYAGDQLTAIEMRFEHHCDGMFGSLRGKVRWTIAEAGAPPGPTYPPPAALWEPPAGVTPSDGGNYVYFESTYGDFIGLANDKLFSASNSDITAYSYTNTGYITGAQSNFRLSVRVRDDVQTSWSAAIVGMSGLQKLQLGYYPDVTRAGSHNHAKGGLDFNGNSRGCNTTSGWFAIDRIQYVNDDLRMIEFRFEQHCEGRSAPLRGKIRWSAA